MAGVLDTPGVALELQLKKSRKEGCGRGFSDLDAVSIEWPLVNNWHIQDEPVCAVTGTLESGAD